MTFNNGYMLNLFIYLNSFYFFFNNLNFQNKKMCLFFLCLLTVLVSGCICIYCGIIIHCSGGGGGGVKPLCTNLRPQARLTKLWNLMENWNVFTIHEHKFGPHEYGWFHSIWFSVNILFWFDVCLHACFIVFSLVWLNMFPQFTGKRVYV